MVRNEDMLESLEGSNRCLESGGLGMSVEWRASYECMESGGLGMSVWRRREEG